MRLAYLEIDKSPFSVENLRILKDLKLRSSRSEFNRRLRATCTKTAAHTWHADAIWKLLLFWATVARRRRLESDLDERSLNLKSYFCLLLIAKQKCSKMDLNASRATDIHNRPHFINVTKPFSATILEHKKGFFKQN